MKPATTIADNGAFSAQKSIFEFALRARKITILGAFATQFHEICGLELPRIDVMSHANPCTSDF
ncbi:MAG: hypothetical protein ACK5GN_00310 [Pseudomonadota bacterium]|jgi:hypothetical protein